MFEFYSRITIYKYNYYDIIKYEYTDYTDYNVSFYIVILNFMLSNVIIIVCMYT